MNAYQLDPIQPAAAGDEAWCGVLDDYAGTLEAQRAYLDAVASGTSDAEPPAPFEAPTGLPPAPDAVRRVIATLRAATLTVLSQHEDLPDRLDRLDRRRAAHGVRHGAARRTTSSTPTVLDREL